MYASITSTSLSCFLVDCNAPFAAAPCFFSAKTAQMHTGADIVRGIAGNQIKRSSDTVANLQLRVEKEMGFFGTVIDIEDTNSFIQ